MPEIENSTRTQPAAPPAPGAVRETRFDPPHKIPRDADSAAQAPQTPLQPSAASETFNPESTPIADSPSAISPELVQQFRLQAQQLAAHLDVRQRDLDRREAE